MIMSGWILPDMHNVECKSCSHSKAHAQIVKRYLDNLKQKDYACYKETIQEFFRLRNKKKVLDFEDFAVLKLGWIKIIDQPIKVVFYSNESPIELLIDRYKNLGYTTISSYEKQSIINICIPSQDLI
ncbi:MAG: hypothetical protein IJ272_04770 [Clostridia bacterium]|nr:hypothetical protein [Clostridia bacterium]